MKRLFALFTIFFFTFGCRQRESSPELKDPIYSDLISQYQAAKKVEEQTEKELEATKKQYEQAQVQTGEYKVRRGQMEDLSAQLRKAQQTLKYLEISLESRKRLDQKTYDEA